VDAIGLEGVVALASHGNHSCALTSGGGVMCWGSSDAGQLGVGVAERLRASSVTVAGLEENIAAVTAGSFHTCVLTEAGGVRCWGDNRLGQLGDGTSGTSRPAPVDVVGLEQGMAAIAAGGEHTCALTEDGILTCWGDNRYGQLGNGTGGEGNFSPTPVGLRTGE
jgi:alpha-tubulin suppressor-like RCC1 family protein